MPQGKVQATHGVKRGPHAWRVALASTPLALLQQLSSARTSKQVSGLDVSLLHLYLWAYS